MIYLGTDIEKDAAMSVAKLMAAAAKTAPNELNSRSAGFDGSRGLTVYIIFSKKAYTTK